jgi:hypothetical protein
VPVPCANSHLHALKDVELKSSSGKRASEDFMLETTHLEDMLAEENSSVR